VQSASPTHHESKLVFSEEELEAIVTICAVVAAIIVVGANI
jgi:hypothetical protein